MKFSTNALFLGLVAAQDMSKEMAGAMADMAKEL